MERKVLKHENNIRYFRFAKHKIYYIVKRKWIFNLEIQKKMESNGRSVHKTKHYNNGD
jgi:hypothetical protein